MAQRISLTQPASVADLAQRDRDRCSVCGDTAGWCTKWDNHAPDPYRREPLGPDGPDDSYYDEPEGWEP